MSEVVDVVVTSMREHAKRLETIGEDGERGVDAAETVSCHGDAFGLLCSFLGTALIPVERVGVLTAKGAVAGIDGTAASMRGLALMFEEADEAISDAFDHFKDDNFARRARM